MHLHFLHGTETGTAEFLCEDLKSTLPDGIGCTISSMDDVDPAQLSADHHYIFVVSTFGSGELPFTAQAFHKKMRDGAPDLSHVHFSIFGLGDTNFDTTFNYGSEQVMKQMLACNARMIGERGLFDASEGDAPEDIAEPWLKEILKAKAAVG